jgi:hypothetical protein
VGFRNQALITLLQTLDRRTNSTDEGVDSSNIIQDTFVPIAERLPASDTVEVEYFVPSTFVWGDGGVTTNANWAWGYGGVWKS